VTGELELRERGRVNWGGVVKSGGGSRPFIGAEHQARNSGTAGDGD
jgi:hypothetical protein